LESIAELEAAFQGFLGPAFAVHDPEVRDWFVGAFLLWGGFSCEEDRIAGWRPTPHGDDRGTVEKKGRRAAITVRPPYLMRVKCVRAVNNGSAIGRAIPVMSSVAGCATITPLPDATSNFHSPGLPEKILE
jgi:hypothetical protein